MSAKTSRFACAVALASLALASGCRQNMHNQHKLKTYRGSDFFADGMGSRLLPAHTVSRGDLQEGAFFTGVDTAGNPLAALPMPLTREVLVRGQERFNIFCSPCHGRLGDGHGMIVQRGYKQPTPFGDSRLRAMPVGYFFNVITAGYGQMPAYGHQVAVADRWAIAAYIRALQVSAGTKVADLTPEQRQKVEAALAAPSAGSGESAASEHAAPHEEP